MPKPLKIIILILCTIVWGCYSMQPSKAEIEQSNSEEMSLLSSLLILPFDLPTVAELNDAYYEENQHYPGSKEELLIFCQSQTQYDHFDSDTLEQMWPFLNMLTISTATRAYYEEKQSYPASKEELLAFCRAHSEYQSFNNDSFGKIQYDVRDDGQVAIGIPIQTQINGTTQTQYLEINPSQNVDSILQNPQTQEQMRGQMQKALQSIFRE